MFRVTIRDMLWLMLVCALSLCWFVANQGAKRLQAENQRLSCDVWDLKLGEELSLYSRAALKR